jgi:hypothetical protein
MNAETPSQHHTSAFGRIAKPGSILFADRGSDADWIREIAMKKGALANIPPKSNRSELICFGPFPI